MTYSDDNTLEDYVRRIHREWHYNDCAKLTVEGLCDCGSIEQHLRKYEEEEDTNRKEYW